MWDQSIFVFDVANLVIVDECLERQLHEVFFILPKDNTRAQITCMLKHLRIWMPSSCCFLRCCDIGHRGPTLFRKTRLWTCQQGVKTSSLSWPWPVQSLSQEIWHFVWVSCIWFYAVGLVISFDCQNLKIMMIIDSTSNPYEFIHVILNLKKKHSKMAFNLYLGGQLLLLTYGRQHKLPVSSQAS